VKFAPVQASSIRLVARLPKGFSSGILEWQVR
jgi:hypothetical protein